ncbi:UDP-glucose--hexose-1-phosphate uridylyltransferase [Irregularibacter muris]|uniref:Galactose-1-phosphate uridylyltransferase n=1 Tax=Irregularibacter muris TaxID=1796619 RepID=A0AAE3HH88_9FIRM|nr:UDP-glucose--hexose-1-phosphate uridylyltransferase [Irregularibacter muris]MCR1898538.1 UDP-glucose--hexose-1-phosphate uridylyltransferase [Irregularibacter muris]
MNIYKEIKRLIQYGIEKRLIQEEDKIYVANKILDILHLDEYQDIQVKKEALENPQEILDNILDYAYRQGILEVNTITYRDLLDTKIMDCFIPRPSEVIRKFHEDYQKSPQLATKNYYEMSTASNYIRAERINKNISWRVETNFGQLDITINLSKPEKDPKAIAAAKNMKSAFYPKCLLCKENEGYQGRINHPARHTHRIIPIQLNQEQWFLQYSPYIYYNEHSIILKGKHEPMKITKDTFKRLLDFISKFPHYFIGSNADLPIVGGSILSHDHFQGGRYEFAMERAPILKEMGIEGFPNLQLSIVKWPMSVIRLRSKKREDLVEAATLILNSWKEYTNEALNILSHTGQEPHNTITPIARYKRDKFELDLVLRNNRTDEQHPMGIFHPHGDVHHIKRENIGLIEVMGLAVLPARLIEELSLLEECLLGNKNLEDYEELKKHKSWYGYLKNKYQGEKASFNDGLKIEVGRKFERALMDAGVFKQDAEGISAFENFILSLSR